MSLRSTSTTLVLVGALALGLLSLFGCSSPHATAGTTPSGPVRVSSLPTAIPASGAVWQLQPGSQLIMKPPGQVDTSQLKLKTAADAEAAYHDATPTPPLAVLCRATTPGQRTTAAPHEIVDRLCWVLCYTYPSPIPAPIYGKHVASGQPSPTNSPPLVTKDIVLLDAHSGQFLLGWNQ